MPRGENQKFKLAYLMDIMLEKTDEEHPLTLAQIMEELNKKGVTAERKSLYSDFSDMTEKLGVEVVKVQRGRETYYYVGKRQFELAEVKLLIDAIQSSKFITKKKSEVLIKKIKAFVSEHQANQLQRQVYVQGRAKTMNESIYYNVDDIHRAIADNKKITFKYYKWDINKNLVERHGGFIFKVSPWALTWDDENYYLVAFDDQDQVIKHYRVDKMKNIALTEEKREGAALFKNFDMAAYSKMNFGMYNGQRELVKIQFENSLCGVFLDRFGKDITFRKVDADHSEVAVEVAVSPQFYGWIFSLGTGVKITGPSEAVSGMKEYIKSIAENYK